MSCLAPTFIARRYIYNPQPLASHSPPSATTVLTKAMGVCHQCIVLEQGPAEQYVAPAIARAASAIKAAGL